MNPSDSLVLTDGNASILAYTLWMFLFIFIGMFAVRRRITAVDRTATKLSKQAVATTLSMLIVFTTVNAFSFSASWASLDQSVSSIEAAKLLKLKLGEETLLHVSSEDIFSRTSSYQQLGWTINADALEAFRSSASPIEVSLKFKEEGVPDDSITLRPSNVERITDDPTVSAPKIAFKLEDTPAVSNVKRRCELSWRFGVLTCEAKTDIAKTTSPLGTVLSEAGYKVTIRIPPKKK